MKHAFSIFVSSVQKELADERRALKEYITRDPFLGRFFPDVFLFEDLPAQDQRPDTLYLAEIECRDIYLGIFRQKYGWKDHESLLRTAREFQHASRATAKRDIEDLIAKGLLVPKGSGRGAYYEFSRKRLNNGPIGSTEENE